MPSTLQSLDSFEIPRFSGLATFMRTPYAPDAEGIDIALVGVPFDFNLSRNGTRFGPSQVREMSRLIRRFPAGGGESPFDLCNVADVGGLDPAYCCGTGAPEPGGLSMRDAQVILRGLTGCRSTRTRIGGTKSTRSASGCPAACGGHRSFPESVPHLSM